MLDRTRLRMHGVLAGLVLVVSMSNLGAPSVYAATINVALNAPITGQQQSQWCWAASTKSAVQYIFGISYSQCQQANDRFNRSDCCTNPSSTNCNQSSPLADVGNYLASKKGINSTHEWSSLSWSQAKSELGTARRPFLVRYGWDGGFDGHIVVARGYVDYDTAADSIGVMDPNGGSYPWYTWSYLKDNSTWTWTNTLWKLNK
ncbi:MAG: papain-like cysteine protease family protein [Chloroflexota bacterium]